MKGKLLLGTLVGLLLLVAMVGVTVADTPTPTPTPTSTPTVQPGNPDKAFADRLAKILGLDPATVEDAVDQARLAEIHDRIDTTVKSKLDKAVKAGKLTQAEADAIYAWVQSRPPAADKFIGNLGLNKKAAGPAGPRHGHNGEAHGKAHESDQERDA